MWQLFAEILGIMSASRQFFFFVFFVFLGLVVRSYDC